MKREAPDGLWYQCPSCKHVMHTREHKVNAYTCVKCNYHEKIGSEAYFSVLFDNAEYTELDANMLSGDPLSFEDTKKYPDRIRAVSYTHLDVYKRQVLPKMTSKDTTIINKGQNIPT